jgi:hypothetical protein
VRWRVYGGRCALEAGAVGCAGNARPIADQDRHRQVVLDRGHRPRCSPWRPPVATRSGPRGSFTRRPDDRGATLRHWRDSKRVARYGELAQLHRGEIETVILREARDVVFLAAEGSAQRSRRRGTSLAAMDRGREEACDLLRHWNSNVRRAVYRAHFGDKRRNCCARNGSQAGSLNRHDPERPAGAPACSPLVMNESPVRVRASTLAPWLRSTRRGRR